MRRPRRPAGDRDSDRPATCRCRRTHRVHRCPRGRLTAPVRSPPRQKHEYSFTWEGRQSPPFQPAGIGGPTTGKKLNGAGTEYICLESSTCRRQQACRHPSSYSPSLILLPFIGFPMGKCRLFDENPSRFGRRRVSCLHPRGRRMGRSGRRSVLTSVYFIALSACVVGRFGGRPG
jgi:hypothetical protein